MHSVMLQLWKALPLSSRVQKMIMRLFNHQFLIGVTGVIFNEQRKVLLFKHTYRRTEWSLPGGYLKSGEHPKAGISREIEEESGFKVNVIKIIMAKEDPKSAHLDLSYFGEYVESEFRPSTEVSSYHFFPINQLPPLIDDQYKQIAEGYKRYTQFKKTTPLRMLKTLFSFFKKTGMFFLMSWVCL